MHCSHLLPTLHQAHGCSYKGAQSQAAEDHGLAGGQLGGGEGLGIPCRIGVGWGGVG